MIHTAGTWDPNEPPQYFIASDPAFFQHKKAADYYGSILCPVNDINTAKDEQFLLDIVSKGKRLLIDSGVFNLAHQHAIKHSMPLHHAFALAPAEVDGFDALHAKYTRIVREIGTRAWGYIEIDQGGKEQKTRTREGLHAAGFQPIPVYHPLGDGWDYFDALAERYDRICVGMFVQAVPEFRKRLLATLWERRRKYPKLWIHCLGLTPSELCLSYPLNSCDSSSWISSVRWLQMPTRACLKAWDNVDERIFRYESQSADKNHIKSVQISAAACIGDLINWQRYVTDSEAILETDHRMGL